MTPHYYKSRYDHAANLAHYHAVADASPVPVIVYVMAAYTGIDLATNLVNELSAHPNIVGVKDSGGNAPKVAEMVAGAAPNFGVSGWLRQLPLRRPLPGCHRRHSCTRERCARSLRRIGPPVPCR